MKPSTDKNIRLIQESDNAHMAKIIREVLTEFGADKPGFAWQDPELDKLTEAYTQQGLAYWVAEVDGQVVGGVGIGALIPAVANTCELQKMYLLPDFRGLGLGKLLIEQALAFAQRHYRWCYLETLANMSSAERLYRQLGYIALPKALVDTEHNACDRWYLKELSDRK